MLALRRPALAQSYEQLLKRIKHTGTVIKQTADGRWYHSSDPTHVREVVDRVTKTLNDVGLEEQLEFEKLCS